MIKPFALKTAAVAAAMLILLPAMAQAASYRGKTITIIVGFGAGGGYDAYGRLMGRHFGKFVAGNPRVIVQNKPGSGSAAAAAYLYGPALQDGTQLGLLNSNLALAKVLGEKPVFDVSKFTYIGRLVRALNFALVASNAPATDIEGAMKHQVILAASGPNSATTRLPMAFNRLMGTKFKLLKGFRGSSRMLHAMEQGEVHGVGGASYTAVTRKLKHWVKAGKIRYLWVTSLKRHPRLPNVPAAQELARTDEQRRILRVLTSPSAFGRVIWGPPKLNADRLKTLRRAFNTMMKDAAFQAEAKKRKLDLEPATGQQVRKIMDNMANAPEALLKKARQASKP